MSYHPLPSLSAGARGESPCGWVSLMLTDTSRSENDRNEVEMEILNLQIQLKAIEVQCLGYVPRDADPDLVESIKSWKSEWSALRRKRAREKEEANSAPSGPPVVKTVTPSR